MVGDPDAVARDEFIAWDTAFWFWRKHVHGLPGVAEGHFGVTTNAINGVLECWGGPNLSVAYKRFEMYKVVRSALNLGGDAHEWGCYN